MDGMEGKTLNKRKVSVVDLVLRFSALVLTLVATIVLGVDKRTKVVPLQLVPTLPPVNVPVSAKWQYISAFVFHVVSNVIACSYAAISILVSLANKGGKKEMVMMIFVLDLVMVALLFSAAGATGAICLMGFKGNSHVQWKKVCGAFDKFCGQVAASIVLSLLGSLAFFFLVAFAASRSLKN